MKDNNPRFLDLYETVVNAISACGEPLVKARAAIEETDQIKKPTKRLLTTRMETAMNELAEVVQKMGELGKVK